MESTIARRFAARRDDGPTIRITQISTMLGLAHRVRRWLRILPIYHAQWTSILLSAGVNVRRVPSG